jgi:hypothetical protein
VCDHDNEILTDFLDIGLAELARFRDNAASAPGRDTQYQGALAPFGLLESLFRRFSEGLVVGEDAFLAASDRLAVSGRNNKHYRNSNQNKCRESHDSNLPNSEKFLSRLFFNQMV